MTEIVSPEPGLCSEAGDALLVTDTEWMARALVLAKRAEAEGEVPVGAVLVADGEVLAEGWNRPNVANDITAHAEMQALRAVERRLDRACFPRATLYVTLEPCLMCAGALVHARVGRLVFGAADPREGAVASVCNVLDQNRLNPRVPYEGGVLADESAELLRAFFASGASSPSGYSR